MIFKENSHLNLKSKINDDAARYELLIARYVVGSKFEEIFTSRDLRPALILRASIRNFKIVIFA